MKKIAIIGYGWVGKAMHDIFPDAAIYSRNLILHEGNWIKDPIAWKDDEKIYKDLVNKCDVAFICVPTPVIAETKLDTSIVEECVSWCMCPLIVIRSTVNPETCDYLTKKYHKRIVMQPEYLGETPQHPMLDTKVRPFLILGGEAKDRRELIDLYTSVYNANVTIRQVTAKEAEIIKLTENRAIFFKVLQCQELYDVCETAGVDYYTIRDAVYGDDPRFNLWWTFIMPDRPRGCISKCLPKDVYAWAAWVESIGYTPTITRSLLDRNKEWMNGKL